MPLLPPSSFAPSLPRLISLASVERNVCACQYPQTNKFSLSLSQPFLHFPLLSLRSFFFLFFNALLVFYDSLFTATAAAAATPSPTPFAACCSFFNYFLCCCLQSALGETFVPSPHPPFLPSLAASTCAPFDVVLVLRCLLSLSLCKKEASATQR